MDLTLDKLACRRAGRLVFNRLDFRLEAGQAAALRGPNGVGKSTLLRQLCGLIPVAGGDARLDGVSLEGDRQGFQERVAYAGHLDAVKPALSIGENLTLWAGIHGNDAGRAGAALARFGLDAIAGRPAAQCSAGQKRRLGLARLLVMDRPLWLLDEPTVSLDADASALVADLVREHVGAGGMALIATHVDLGLGDIPVLMMSAPEAGAHDADDPFLAGAWT
ncbi:MAG TPA: heme ABC exporter ATP-binding protein CcmA [Thermohalobaculum sp.]|nr:heme ABC exporter ATP-binding protein CcmA [Thermohalobaculum sp.]